MAEKISAVIRALEKVAPNSYQESYDNAGLLTGDVSRAVTGVLCSLDCIETVVDEAIEKSCNLIVAHHPIVFKGLKRITGKNYVERTIIKAIKNDIAIYAIHTNLDNVLHNGVNTKIGQRLGLKDLKILAPKRVSNIIQFELNATQQEEVINELTDKGYTPTLLNGHGEKLLFQLVVDQGRIGEVKRMIQRDDSNDSIDPVIYGISNQSNAVGSGMIGRLEEAISEHAFLELLKNSMGAKVVRHTKLLNKAVQTVAFCGGAGSFLLKDALRKRADFFVTADYKYHEFFDADGKIVIADIGHFESEQFTIDLLHEIITKTFSSFAVYKTEHTTNPVSYYF
ncbi:MAG: Nif3-like dinuclear metal center hexameric protein [Bacteroidota bacterium]